MTGKKIISLSLISRTFVDTLNRNGVKYLLVGGHAVQYYGSERETRDLDLWIGTESENAQKLMHVLSQAGLSYPELTREPFEQSRRIIRIQLSPPMVEILDPVMGQRPILLQKFYLDEPEPIEILTVQTGMEFEAAYAERVVDVLGGLEVSIVSRRDLEAIKRSTNGKKDMEDAVFLMKAV